ncbi:hypothetical protein BGZ52_009483 [Haplosporangium bisporale]|nr:hypothetical protein BGZ52_009483 [Haplosporangium bisporale]KAF9209356.1 hypothetical protein BGZ59_010159 [Podila verticillata]KFH70795.1 hypothetical protein MVEG_03643 [Podila verticillata NRRL 6337]
MACIILLTNWGIDIIPAVVVQLGPWFSSKLETMKSQMLAFVSTKKYLKWLIISCWALGSFVYFCIVVVFPKIREQTWHPTLVNILGALVAGLALIFVEKVLLQIISKIFHQTAYENRIKENKYELTVLDQLGTSFKNVKKPV